MSPQESRQRVRLTVGGILLTLLLAAVFTMGSLDVPFEPGSWKVIIALYALSSLIIAALLVFGLILTRSIVRLWMERSKEQPGARFKTKMVLGAMAISLLPVIFMFFVSYSVVESHTRSLVSTSVRNCFRGNSETAQRSRPYQPAQAAHTGLSSRNARQ